MLVLYLSSSSFSVIGIRVDVEAHGDLGNSMRGRGNAGQLELAQQVVIAGAGALALVYE